jgi:hypothetical protein
MELYKLRLQSRHFGYGTGYLFRATHSLFIMPSLSLISLALVSLNFRSSFSSAMPTPDGGAEVLTRNYVDQTNAFDWSSTEFL